MALARASALAAVLPCVSLIAVTGAVHAASTGEAVFGAEEFRAVGTGPGLMAHADRALTAATAPAVVLALGLGAVSAEEAFGTDAGPSHAPAVGAAFHGTGLGRAVFSPEAFRAFARSVNAAGPTLAGPGTVQFGAVGSPPAGFTCAAAAVAAVVSVAVTVRSDGHFTFNTKSALFVCLYQLTCYL